MRRMYHAHAGPPGLPSPNEYQRKPDMPPMRETDIEHAGQRDRAQRLISCDCGSSVSFSAMSSSGPKNPRTSPHQPGAEARHDRTLIGMMEILGTVATLYGIEVSSRSSAKSLSAPYTASLA